MYNKAFELQVLVNGRPVKETTFQGNTFIEARRGTQYTLKLKNNTHRRALAVFSVDGIDVLRGKKAEETGSGYIVDSYSQIEIKGFRVDDENVSAFRFDDKKESYANKVGAKTSNGKIEKTTNNCGVIGVKVTLEEESPVVIYQAPVWTSNSIPPWNPSLPPSWTNITGGCYIGSMVASGCSISPQGSAGVRGSSSSRVIASNCSFSLNAEAQRSLNSTSVSVMNFAAQVEQPEAPAAPNFTLGTTWGEKIEDKVMTVDFKRSSETVSLVLYYGERHELEAYGIDFSPKKKVSTNENWPKAFGKKNEYCAIPNYK